jgi:hypothetical protein
MLRWVGAAVVALIVLSGASMGAAAQGTIAGTWQGSYECPQGPTGLTLTIEGDTPHALKGNFRFYPTPDNARPAQGDYEVAISFDPASLRIEVQGTRWIDRPPGYEFANLRGVLQGRQLIGTVENAGCGAFELTRAGS